MTLKTLKALSLDKILLKTQMTLSRQEMDQ